MDGAVLADEAQHVVAKNVLLVARVVQIKRAEGPVKARMEPVVRCCEGL